MKKFKFEITLTEEDVNGDEFWEEALKRDGTGIAELTEYIETMLADSNLMITSERKPKDVVKLISYTDEK